MNSRAQAAITLPVDWVAPLREIFDDLLRIEEVHRYLAEMLAGTDVCYPMDEQDPHPLLGRRLPDLPLSTPDGTDSVFGALRPGRGVLLDFSGGTCGAELVAGWKDRVEVVTADPSPAVEAPALLLRPDGHVAWTGGRRLLPALTTWFGEPVAR